MMEASRTYDYVIIGSGFGGSVSAMRLTEKGYSVLVLERGLRFRDEDFPKSTWNVFKYLWAPVIRCFGILQISLFRDVMVLHGNGVGGGSLGYANVLMKPSDDLFNNPSWKHLADWKSVLEPHYATASCMLGVTKNPRFWASDHILREIAAERGRKGRPGIKLGICGEHGGDPASIRFCQKVGLDYVSCSPVRVPIARLAAAQAALAEVERDV